MKIARYPMFQAEDRVTYLASLEREKKPKKNQTKTPQPYTTTKSHKNKTTAAGS